MVVAGENHDDATEPCSRSIPPLGRAALTLALLAVLRFAEKQSPALASTAAPAPARCQTPIPARELQRPARASRSWIDTAKRTYASFNENRILAVAAGITFYGLLAIFPALAAFLALYGLFADYNAIQSHLGAMSSILPGGAVEIIGDQIKRIASKGGSALGGAFFIGFATSLWSANAGMKALIDGLNIAYEVPETRGFIKLNIVSLAFTLGAILCSLLALSLVVIVPVVLVFVGLGGWAEVLIAVGRWPILLALIVFVLAVLYRFGTSPHGARWRLITPGSVIAGVAWLIASFGFSYYAAHFGSYNETYGSLGAAIGFMTWIWLSSTVFLAGAELNGKIEAVLGNKKNQSPDPICRSERPALH